jgi:hypothetical protein
MKLSLLSLLFFILSAFLVTACKSDDPEDPANPDYLAEADCTGLDVNANTYAAAIEPILSLNCALGGCHNTASANAGVILDTYAGAKKAFNEQPGLCAIHHGEGCLHMPDGGGKLPDEDIRKIDCWAKNGYKQ